MGGLEGRCPPCGTAEIRPGWAMTLVQVNVREGRSKRSELLGAAVRSGWGLGLLGAVGGRGFPWDSCDPGGKM